ncbi:MAG: hypothetical protein EXS01_04165 [Phycisphaerales bacterium]|nr:hypothetical protein [Phycisphaerales bacterium]
MHILTKVFVVLVSLLAVALVPLAAVQANNQAGLKQQVKDRESQVSAARMELDTERALRAKSENDTALQIKDLDAERSRLQSDLAQSNLRARGLESDIAKSTIRLTSLEQTIAITAESDRAKTALTTTLSEELDSQRTMVVDCERIRIDLEQKLGKTDSDLRVAQEALSDLKEQVAALSNEKSKADQVVREFTAKFGLSDADAAAPGALAPVADRNLSAQIIDVQRSDDIVYAEIDAGSRDGVKDGWVMTISDGSRFIGKLRVTKTDVNKSVGTVELEDVEGRGPVQAGQRASVRKGQ